MQTRCLILTQKQFVKRRCCRFILKIHSKQKITAKKGIAITTSLTIFLNLATRAMIFDHGIAIETPPR